MEKIMMHMSGIYKKQSFYDAVQENMQVFDNCDMRGTDCYCDEQAMAQIEKQIQSCTGRGIHFIDSGNYHYLTYLWLKKIDGAFGLILFDHHPDIQAPLFGNILSCGGWVKMALDTLPHLQWVLCVGVNEDLLADREEDVRVSYLTEQEIQKENIQVSSYINTWLQKKCVGGKRALPVYVSVDKDVLEEEALKTNWDNGTLSEAEIMDGIRMIAQQTQILGLDICGEPANEEESDVHEIQKSDAINHRFMDFINNLEKNLI